MATTRVNLDVTQYVRVTSDPLVASSLLLQSHRDTVRIAFSDAKPVKGNEVFHELGGEHPPLNIPLVDTAVWALATTDRCALTATQQELPAEEQKTAFGELSVAEPTPFIQISSEYGTLDDIFVAEGLGGTSSNVDGMFQVSTGMNPFGLSSASSLRQIRYRPGQGVLGRIDGVFSAGVVNSVQFIGLFNSAIFAGFGYEGTAFGILSATGGKLETQELQVTSAATGSENATVTVSGNAFSVPLTAGTVQHNAYEIATSLNAQDPTYMYSSNNDKVIALASTPFFPSGAFAFTSASAVASWTQIEAQNAPDETWVPQSEWNVNNLSSWSTPLDPTKGNQFQVRLCSGFGIIKYYVEDPESGEFIHVHSVKNGNTLTTPFAETPAFRIGGAVRNIGNTSDVILKGTSASAFVEGNVLYDNPSKSFSTVALGIGTLQTNIASFRNRLVFAGKTNRSEILPLLISASTDTGKIAKYQIVANPVFSGDLIFNYIDESNSLMEVATDNVILTDGDVLLTFDAVEGNSVLLNLQTLLRRILPDSTVAITAAVNAGPSSTMSISFTEREDT